MSTKFIYVTTTNTEADVNQRVAQLDKVHVEILQNLYDRLRFCEFVDASNFKCMYAIADERTLQQLCQQYVNLGITFTFNDISRTVLFRQPFLCKTLVGENKELANKLCAEYVDENLDLNTVLEKISELGSDKLTEHDIQILKQI